MYTRTVVNETEQVRKHINSYKRLLERPELYNHAALHNGQYYYNIQYWRLGKKEAVGYLILREDGSVPPRSEATPVVLLVMSHNTFAINFTKNFAVDKDKPVWMFEQKRDHLRQLLPYCEQDMDEQTRRDAYSLLTLCEYMAESVNQLQEIYDRGMAHHHQFLARMYVTEEDFAHLDQVLHESDYLLYDRLVRQMEQKGAVDRVYAYFTSTKVKLGSEQQTALRKLINLLRDYKRSDIWSTMAKSIRHMELNGSPYRGEEEMRLRVEEEYKRTIPRLVLPLLRNP
jgi:hypothetical protein